MPTYIGHRWNDDDGTGSGGVSMFEFPVSSPISGGVVAWSIAGGGLANETGTEVFTGLTVGLNSFLPDNFIIILEQAFEAWSNVANIEFIRVVDGGGNIGVGSFPAIRIAGGLIDGAPAGSDTWGHTLNLSLNASGGDIVFDSGNNLSDQQFEWLALHEIGHALGLSHSSDETLMYGFYNSGVPVLGPTTDDINGMQALYGDQDDATSHYYMPNTQQNIDALNTVSGSQIFHVHGNALDNEINGSSEADLLEGGAGDDTLIGGDGDIDIAVFSEFRDNYDIWQEFNGEYTVVHARGSAVDGMDTLSEVEFAQFSDQTFVLGNFDPIFASGPNQPYSIQELLENDAEFNHHLNNTLTFSDANYADSHSISVQQIGGGSFLGDFEIDTLVNTAPGDSQFSWTFDITDSALDFLDDLQNFEQVYRIVIDDGNGGLASTDVTINFIGAMDAPFLSANANSFGDEFTVNEEIEGYQRLPQILQLANGQALFTWDSNDPDVEASGYGISARIGTPNGNSGIDWAGDELTVNNEIENSQHSQQVMQLANGQLLFTWYGHDPDVDGSSSGISARIGSLDGSGSINWAGEEFTVNDEIDASQHYPQIMQLADGQVLFTWQSYDPNVDGSESGISTRIGTLDGSGSINWAGDEFTVNDQTESFQFNPHVLQLANGQVLFIWESYDPNVDGSSSGIAARIGSIDGSGVINWSGNEFAVNEEVEGTQTLPQLLLLTNGQVLFTWRSNDPDVDGSASGISARIGALNDSGGIIWAGGEFTVNNEVDSAQNTPQILQLSSGQLLFTWQGIDSDGGGGSIRARIGSLDGIGGVNWVGDEFTVDSRDNSYNPPQYSPQITELTNDQVLFTWYGGRINVDGSVSDITGRILTLSDQGHSEDQPIALNIDAALIDTGGSETLSITISGLPENALLTNGIRNADSTWTLTQAQLIGLEINLAANYNGFFTLIVSAISTVDSTGEVATTTVELPINISPVNDAPIDIILAGSSVDENAGTRAVVGTLSAIDPDGGDTATFAITNDPSGLFDISGNDIIVAQGAEIDYETSASHDLTILVTDGDGLTHEEVLTIDVNDVSGLLAGEIGSAASETLHGTSEEDVIFGIAGDDIIYGRAGNDQLDGGADNDLIDGGLGNDLLAGLAGADLLLGQDGLDTINLSGSTYHTAGYVAHNVSSSTQVGTDARINLAGLVRIEAVTDGGSDFDTINLSDEGDAFFLHDAYSEFHGSVTLTQDYVGNDSAARFSNIEFIYGLGGNDIIDLTSPDYSLAGVSMTIDGGSGNDVIWGSDADEIIYGGIGDDRLFGGIGLDVLYGGAGADIFELTRTSTNTSILDLDTTQGDRLLVHNTGGAEFDENSLALTDVGFTIDYIDAVTSQTHELNITLAETPDEFNLTLIDIQDALDVI